jgi:hypothetical protein
MGKQNVVILARFLAHSGIQPTSLSRKVVPAPDLHSCAAFLRDLHLWHRYFSSDRNFSREINILNGIEQFDAFLHWTLKCLSTGD